MKCLFVTVFDSLKINATVVTGQMAQEAGAKSPLWQDIQHRMTLERSLILTAFHLPSLHLGNSLEVRLKSFGLVIHYLTMLDRFVIQLCK